MLENIIKILEKYSNVYLQGLCGTLWLAAVALLAGSVLGLGIALLRMLRFRPLQWLIRLYIELLRGTPQLLQLYFFWLLLPEIMPFELSDTSCIVVALVVNASAYVAEIIRAGIQAVDPGQREAAESLGMSEAHVMMRIIMPQAVKNILPALGNQFIIIIKSASLSSIFFINELTTSYRTITAATFLTIEPLIISGLLYFTVTLVLSQLLKIFERRLKKNER